MMQGVSRFGSKIRLLRTQRRLTLQDLAAEFGYSSHTYLSEVERGWKQPSLEMVLRAADFFGVSTDSLLRDNIRLEIEDDDGATG